jgi:phosphoglycerate dehydrogenase-like enzyme
LIKALQQGWIAGAGLDVFEKEPIDSDNLLLSIPTVIATPHVAYYSVASLKKLKSSVGQEVARALSGFWPKHVVNKSVVPKVSLRKSED